MNQLRKLVLLMITCLLPNLLWAQSDVEMADTMRANGKIYVVIIVLSVVLAGLLFFLINIDLRLRRLEKKQDN